MPLRFQGQLGKLYQIIKEDIYPGSDLRVWIVLSCLASFTQNYLIILFCFHTVDSILGFLAANS
jgi:hypothetical protein